MLTIKYRRNGVESIEGDFDVVEHDKKGGFVSGVRPDGTTVTYSEPDTKLWVMNENGSTVAVYHL